MANTSHAGRRAAWTIAVVALAIGGLSAQPNPYKRDAAWAQLPPGMMWAAVIGAEQGPDGNIYVLHRCFQNSCAGRSEPALLAFSPAGKLLRSWGSGLFVFPHGFHVDRAGNIWVTDARAANGKGHQVFKFAPDGKLLLTLGKAGVAGSDPGTFNEPTAIVTAPNGDIFITEGHLDAATGKVAGNNRVVRLSKDGTFVKAFGKPGAGPGEFNGPHTIAMDSRGRLFVGDRNNNRIQIFDQNGTFIDQWKQFSRPSGIFIAPDDTIYVADSESWGPDNPGFKKGIRVGSAKDGTVKYFIEDIESTTTEHSGAEGVSADKDGNVYGAVVRRQMLERHVKQGK